MIDVRLSVIRTLGVSYEVQISKFWSFLDLRIEILLEPKRLGVTSLAILMKEYKYFIETIKFLI